MISVATLQGILRDLGGGERLYGYVGEGDEDEEDGNGVGVGEEVSNNSAQDGDSEGRACSPRDSEDGHAKDRRECEAWYIEGQKKGDEDSKHGDREPPWDVERYDPETRNTSQFYPEHGDMGQTALSAEAADKEAHFHSDGEHGTQVIHYICGCSHTVFFNNDDVDDDDSQLKVPEYSHAGVVCGRCLEREKLGRIAVVDVEELEKMVEELAFEKGLGKELQATESKVSLQADRERLVDIEETGEEDDFSTFGEAGGAASPTSPINAPLQSNSQGANASILDDGGLNPEQAGKENDSTTPSKAGTSALSTNPTPRLFH